jgi:hypothetical protein
VGVLGRLLSWLIETGVEMIERGEEWKYFCPHCKQELIPYLPWKKQQICESCGETSDNRICIQKKFATRRIRFCDECLSDDLRRQQEQLRGFPNNPGAPYRSTTTVFACRPCGKVTKTRVLDEIQYRKLMKSMLPSASQDSTSENQRDVVEALKDLADLWKSGALTEDEYMQAKRIVLESSKDQHRG